MTSGNVNEKTVFLSFRKWRRGNGLHKLANQLQRDGSRRWGVVSVRLGPPAIVLHALRRTDHDFGGVFHVFLREIMAEIEASLQHDTTRRGSKKKRKVRSEAFSNRDRSTFHFAFPPPKAIGIRKLENQRTATEIKYPSSPPTQPHHQQQQLTHRADPGKIDAFVFQVVLVHPVVPPRSGVNHGPHAKIKEKN